MEVFWLLIHTWIPSHGIPCVRDHVLWQLDQPTLDNPADLLEYYTEGDKVELYGPFQRGDQKGIVK
jgi:hypothetical protein